MNFSILFGIILSFLNLGEAVLLGSKECTYGPSYWCGNIRNAKECNAVKHCIQTVWEKQELPEDNDDVCKICKDMVTEAREQLLSNETQEEIRQVFEGSCKLIPLEEVRKECIKLSDEFIPELIDTLASQMNPQAVCATAGLCNNPFVDRLFRELKKENDNKKSASGISASDNCKDCKTFVKDVAQTVRRHSRADVLNHLLAICGRLSSLSEGCMALVQDNFQVIYNFLTTDLNPDDICDLFGMCDRMYGETLVKLPKSGEEPCDFCVAIVNSWRNNLVANTTIDEFKMILDGLCHQMGKFEKECLSLVEEYFEVIYDILVSEIHPKEICKAVGLCGPNSVFNSDIPVWTTLQMHPRDYLPMVPLQPSFDRNNLIGVDEANSYRHNIHLPEQPLSRNSISVVVAGEKGVIKNGRSNKCVMCEFVLHFLQNVLQDDETRTKIEKAVEKVCFLLPDSVSEECQDYIEAYGDQLIQLLILEIDPATICPLLNLCPGEKVIEQRPLKKKHSSCVLCEFAMTELDEILKDKSNEEAIKAAVDSICTVMPKTVKKQCKDFVDTYIDQIVDLLVNDFTPAEVCTQLGLCVSKKGNGKLAALPEPESAQLPISRYFLGNPVGEAIQKKVGQKKDQEESLPCIICEFIVSRVDDLILANYTAKELLALLQGICIALPSTASENCLNFVDGEGTHIVNLILQGIAPKFLCRILQACAISDASQVLPKAAIPFPLNKCLICEKVMDWVEVHKEDLEEENASASLLLNQKLCQQFYGKAEHLCTDLAVNYGEVLTKILNELKSKKKSCQALKMCPYHNPKQLLGSKKCTWGPSYWCQSKLHAEACQATEHCEKKVWTEENNSLF